MAAPLTALSASLPTAEQPQFYAVDLSRITLRERLAFEGSGRARRLVSALIERLLRLRAPCSLDEPPVEALAPFRVGEADLPDTVRSELEPLAAALAELGFGSPVWHRVDDGLLHAETVLVTFTHASGEAFARLHHRRWMFVTPPRRIQFVEVVSAFEDGTFLWTSGTAPGLDAPPECRREHHPDASPAALWEVHRARLAGARQARAVRPLRTPAAAEDAAERLHRLIRDRQLARGVFVARSEAEEARAQAWLARRRDVPDADADVLAELERAEQPRVGTRHRLLLGSLLLFVGLGAWRWSLEFVALLTAVLILHELGHFVAMRAFGYRDVRMFFIPLLGAAVTGRRRNVAAWKQVVVSLMGPVPGVVLGAALVGVWLVTGETHVFLPAVLLLAVNGLNLAPVLPLDGGWVVRRLVSARHYLLDVAFVVLAAAALIAFGQWSGDLPFTVIGAVLLLGVRSTWRTGVLVRRLRAEPLPPCPIDGDGIPPALAGPIIAQVRAAGWQTNARDIAAQTLAVVDAMTTRPPGWVATLGLGAVYAGSVVLCAAAFAALAAGEYLLRPWLEPRGRLAISALAESGAAYDGGAFVIATFDEPEAARAAYAALVDRPPGAPLALFGQSVLFAPSEGGEPPSAFDDAALLALDDADVRVAITCHMPDEGEARRTAERLAAFFDTVPSMLVPPWADPDPRTPEQRARDERARATYRQVSVPWGEIYTSAIAEPWIAALRDAGEDTWDDPAVVAANDELSRLHRVAEERRIAELQSQPDADVDAELLAAYAAALQRRHAGADDMSPAPIQPVFDRMGSLYVAAAAAPEIERQAAIGADVSAHGTLLRLDDVWFEDPFRGPRAVARWLHASGCERLRYAFAE